MIEYTVKVYDNGTRHWYLNGELHREDGPAIEYASGDKYWWLNGKPHREDGPAIEWADGDKEWYLEGKRHRKDGPAKEWADGTKSWWLNGKQMTEKEHAEATSKVQEMTMEEVCEALGKNIKIKSKEYDN